MSTASTMSSVTHTPPASQGHSYRPSRGHNRSGRWTQIPSFVATSAPSEQESKQEPSQPGHWATAAGSAHHHHTHSHSHSHSQSSLSDSHLLGDTATTTTRVDAAADGLLGSSGPSTSSVTPFQSSGSDIPLSYEIVTGTLTVLPWVVLSWYTRLYTEPTSNKLYRLLKAAAAKSSWFRTYSIETKVDTVWWRTMALVSVTMLLIGSWSWLRRKRAGQGLPNMSSLDLAAGQTALTRILSLGLPIYAAMIIGAPIVALAFILTFAAGLPAIFDRSGNHGAARERLGHKKASLFVLSTFIVLNVLGFDAPVDVKPLRGYIALFVSIFLLRPPFSSARDAVPAASQPNIDSLSKFADGAVSLIKQQISAVSTCPLVASAEDIQLTLVSGALLAALTVLLSPFSGAQYAFGVMGFLWTLVTAACFTVSLTLSSPSSLRTRQKIGHVAASVLVILFSAVPHAESSRLLCLTWVVVAVLSYFAAIFDDHKHGHASHGHSEAELSTVTKFLLKRGESYPILYSILKEDDSRRIFYFMSLNFAFMLVQLCYGFITGSLGLLSDSIHMFFDCLALVVGLCAAVMSKWPPSARFPYGYGKVDTLSGFANGVFLMIISVEIVYEAIERLLSGSQMHRIQELLVVSIAGLAVNLVGIMAFDHAHHGHSHGGHGHGHDHGHRHGHGHSHSNENMHGIFLHILADTLGSVAVVISTILVHFYGWAGFDPIASCIIAILIFVSAVPLVSSTAKTLLLTLPADVEYNLRDTLAGVSTLRGVVGYTVPKFWLDDTAAATSTGHDHGHHHHHGHSHSHSHGHSNSHDLCHHHHEKSHSHDDYHHHHQHSHDHDHDHDHDHHDHKSDGQRVLGVIHVIASRSADLEDVRRRTVDFLREKNMDIVVQVEREGEGRCWCGTGVKSS
ncbi:hypothetical protein VTN77DRAFT_4722 [Rasamsonia byssochlamydoides]|uniref:uncharacterized protein n=1 Tax=Rasamsonia byssochlamydoides TaxID=89139 RepID=UPI003743941F